MASDVGGAGPVPEEIETETLLAQGDELIRSSRDLLEQLDDALSSPPEDA